MGKMIGFIFTILNVTSGFYFVCVYKTIFVFFSYTIYNLQLAEFAIIVTFKASLAHIERTSFKNNNDKKQTTKQQTLQKPFNKGKCSKAFILNT